MTLRASMALAGVLAGACTHTVQGLDDGVVGFENVAGAGTASQTSTLTPHGPTRAIDNDLATFSHTSAGQTPARWELILPGPRLVRRVTIHSRRTCCRDRNRDLNLILLDRPGGKEVFNHAVMTGKLINEGNALAGPDRLEVDLWAAAGRAMVGAVLRIERRPDPENLGYDSPDRELNMHSLNLAEVEVWVPQL